jgi:hypothetical protein
MPHTDKPILLTVTFQMDSSEREAFLEEWGEDRKIFEEQEGLIAGWFVENPRPGNRAEFRNVAIWETEEHMHKARQAVNKHHRHHGLERMAFWRRRGITIHQDVYAVEIPYGAAKDLMKDLV